MRKTPTGHSDLNALDQLILKKLNPKSILFQFTHLDIPYYEATIQSLEETVKESILTNVYQRQDEGQILCLVQNYQRHLVYLCDHLDTYRDKFKETEDINLYIDYHWVLEFAIVLVLGLLDFIQFHFVRYFDQEKEVPNVLRENTQRYFDEKISRLTKTTPKISKELWENVLLSEFRLSNTNNKQITFRKIKYLKNLMTEILEVSRSKDKKRDRRTENDKEELRKDIEEAIRQKLIYFNFNSINFYSYMVDQISEAIQHKTDREKLLLLSWYDKQIKQTEDKSDGSLQPHCKSIAERLTGWIKEEMQFIEKHPQQANLPSHAKEEETPGSEKIKLAISVPQLGCFVALLVKAGLVHEKEKTVLVKYLTNGFRTQQSENISQKHLTNRTTEKDFSTREFVKAKLLQMVHLLNTGF